MGDLRPGPASHSPLPVWTGLISLSSRGIGPLSSQHSRMSVFLSLVPQETPCEMGQNRRQGDDKTCPHPPRPAMPLVVPKCLGQQEGSRTGTAGFGEERGSELAEKSLHPALHRVRRCGVSDLGSPEGRSEDHPDKDRLCQEQQKPATLNRGPSSWDPST